jgi:hypothetical protein
MPSSRDSFLRAESFTAQQKKERQDLLDRKDQLAAIDKSYSDPGCVICCGLVLVVSACRHDMCTSNREMLRLNALDWMTIFKQPFCTR